jgi:hypothetical protein
MLIASLEEKKYSLELLESIDISEFSWVLFSQLDLF